MGDLLVTVDARKTLYDDSLLSSLKFWRLDPQTAVYRLSAQMDSPHQHFRLTDISLSINPFTCASASVDGTVKVWKGSSSNNSNNSLDWKCSYSFRYRDCPVTSLCFSSDGSVMVVAHQNLCSIWDPVRLLTSSSILTYIYRLYVTSVIV